jgi:hypothetical protein
LLRPRELIAIVDLSTVELVPRRERLSSRAVNAVGHDPLVCRKVIVHCLIVILSIPLFRISFTQYVAHFVTTLATCAVGLEIRKKLLEGIVVVS